MVSIGMVMVIDPPFAQPFLDPLEKVFLLGTPESSGAQNQHSDYTCVFLALAACAVAPVVTAKTKDCSWIEVEHVSACLSVFVLNPALFIGQYALYGAFPALPASAPSEVGLILLAAGGSFVGLGMETKGYQLAEVGKASMYRYIEVPFAYLLQHFGTSQPVQTQAVVGSMLIVASCLLSVKRTSSEARESINADNVSKNALLADQ